MYNVCVIYKVIFLKDKIKHFYSRTKGTKFIVIIGIPCKVRYSWPHKRRKGLEKTLD
jgi:hypothetical protein